MWSIGATIIKKNNYSIQLSKNHKQTAIANTRASSRCIRPNDQHFKTGIKPPMTFGLLHGNLHQSTIQACQLSLSQLPEQACAHVIPGLTHSSLVSIGKRCNAWCEAIFDKAEVKIIKDNKKILSGHQDLQTELWRIPLVDPTTHSIPPMPIPIQCHNPYQMNKIPDLIQLLYRFQPGLFHLDQSHPARIFPIWAWPHHMDRTQRSFQIWSNE